MSEPFLGQIQPMAFNFAPKGWALCDGQIMNIAQNTALFSLLGTTYGGNGQTTFALPDLRGRAPMHFGVFAGQSYVQGEQGGLETVTLLTTEMPIHSHTFFGTTDPADSLNPDPGDALAAITNKTPPPGPYYGPDTTPQPLNSGSVATTGNSQPHNNMQPYLVINWCIATAGVFPSRN